MLLFFAGALLLYVPGIWWGLPDGTGLGRDRPWGSDELGPVGAINELYGVFAAHHPSFNPQYPLFQYIWQAIFVGPYYVALWLTHHLSYPDPNFPFGLDDPPFELGVMTILARSVSLLMGAGVVAVAFATGEVLGNRRTAIVAALLVLLEYPMFYYSRTSNVDMGALFWTALGLLVFAQCLRHGVTLRRGLALGVFAGLAVAAKDPSYGAFLPVGVVFLFLHVRAVRRAGKGFDAMWQVPAAALGAASTAYVVASGLVFRPSRYLQHFRYVTHGSTGPGRSPFYFRYPPTPTGYLHVANELAQQLINAMGLPMLICACAGIAYWALRRREMLPWVLPAVGVIVGVILPVRFVLLRFVLIVVYVLAFCAADLLSRWSERARGLPRAAALAVTVAVVGWSALRGADLTYQMLYDSRYTAARWLAATMRPGDRVGHAGPAGNLPHLPPEIRTTALNARRLQDLPGGSGPEFIVAMALQDFESEHERALPEETYQALVAGTLGYRQAAVFRGASLFRDRPATFVNPPVHIFVRDDVWQRRLNRTSSSPDR